jgi:hypothetical protein
MNKWILSVFLIVISVNTFAQEDLFGKKTTESNNPVAPSHHGWLIAANGDLDFPAADMAKRFGTSYRIGPSVMYKTADNFLFGVKWDFISGNQIRQDSLMANLYTSTGDMLDQNGTKVSPRIYERGYMVGISAGKIFNVSKKNKDNGIACLLTLGFIQHKILIISTDNEIPAIRGDYVKGYDRLTNGAFLEAYTGYAFFGKEGLMNFNLGLDLAAGFTQGRRDYLFDVMRPDNQKRTDILFGLRGTWYIPIFKKKSEEYVF